MKVGRIKHIGTLFFLVCVIALVGLFLVYKTSPHTEQASAEPTAITDPTCNQTEDSLKFKCYEAYFNAIIDTQDARVALNKLDALRKTNNYLDAQCHPLVHSIGHHSFDKYGSVSAAAKYGSELCWSGYYHGVMERYMAGFDDTKLLSMMPTICVPTDKPYSFDYYNCLHGLGHGLTIRFDNDIFKALPFCKAIGKAWEIESCYSGIFMQNIVVDGISHTSKNLKSDDPLYPCDAVDQDQKNPCYLIITSHFMQITNYDNEKSFALCDKVTDGFITTCYQSMGRDISGNALLDTATIIKNCAFGQDTYRSYCYVGAVKNDVFNDRNTVKADALCNAAPALYKDPCIAAKNEASSTL